MHTQFESIIDLIIYYLIEATAKEAALRGAASKDALIVILTWFVVASV